MDYKKYLKSAIFCSDEHYSYRVREICRKNSLDPVYLKNLQEFMEYVIKEKTGILLIDLKYAKFVKLMEEYCDRNNNILIIYLSDNKNVDVNFLNTKNIKTNIDGLGEILPRIMEKLTIYKNDLYGNIPVAYAYKQTAEYLKKCGVSPKLAGYYYIMECVATAINLSNRKFVFKKDIYPAVASKIDTSIANIEKCIRVAIAKAEESSGGHLNMQEFNNSSVTNTDFLNHLIINIKLNYLDNNIQKVS